MRMVKTSLKPYMLFLEEEYFFCKAVREKNNSVKDNSKLIYYNSASILTDRAGNHKLIALEYSGKEISDLFISMYRRNAP
jgi:hypothetical protein